MIALWLGTSLVVAGGPGGSSDQAWDGPVPWRVVEADSDPLPAGSLQDAAAPAFQHWRDAAPCAAIDDEFRGVEPEAAEVREGEVLIRFGLDGDMPGGWSSLACETEETGRPTACELVLSSTDDWVTTEVIQAGECVHGYAIEALLTHMLGHLLGASDEDHWFLKECALPDPWVSDSGVDAVTAAQLDTLSTQPLTDTAGAVPLEVCFEVDGDVGDVAVGWDFGDGIEATTTGREGMCHTFEEQGEYTVGIEYEPSDECGTLSWDEPALVLACLPPGAPQGSLFSVEVVGQTLELTNQVDTSVPACVDFVQWQLFDGDAVVVEVEAWSPKLEVPGPGNYTVVATMSGVGGETVESLGVTVGPSTGCGSRFAVLFAVPLLGLVRSRGDDASA